MVMWLCQSLNRAAKQRAGTGWGNVCSSRSIAAPGGNGSPFHPLQTGDGIAGPGNAQTVGDTAQLRPIQPQGQPPHRRQPPNARRYGEQLEQRAARTPDAKGLKAIPILITVNGGTVFDQISKFTRIGPAGTDGTVPGRITTPGPAPRRLSQFPLLPSPFTISKKASHKAVRTGR